MPNFVPSIGNRLFSSRIGQGLADRQIWRN